MKPLIKVVYIVGSSAFGGAVKHVYDLCSRLDRSRFELACISPPDGPLPGELEAVGIRAHVIDLYQYRSPSTWRRVISCLRKEEPDIVHAHGPSAFLFASYSSSFAAHPAVIGTFHSLYLQEKIDRMQLNAFARAKARTFAWLERRASMRANQLVFVSDADRQEYCQAAGRHLRAVTIPNGIDLAKFTPDRDPVPARDRWGIGPVEKVVGCVSRLSAEKGVGYLLRAFPRIADAYQDVRLLLVGDGAQRSELQKLARELGIGDRVIFTGHSSDVPGLISAMDIVVLPSLWEGQPLAVLEGWAMEKPVVATRVRGTEQLVREGETGILVPARDPDSLASAVSGLLSDAQLGRGLGKAGRRTVESCFDLDKTCLEVSDLYLHLAQGRAHVAGKRA